MIENYDWLKVEDYKPNNNKMFKLTSTNIKSAVVYVVLSAVIQVAAYITGVGDVFNLESHALINIAVNSLLTGFTSVVKNLLTNEDGKFLGAAKVAGDK